MANDLRKCLARKIPRFACAVLLAAPAVFSQSVPQPADTQGAADQNDRIETLNKSLEQTRTELAETRAELHQLRSMLEQLAKDRTGAANTAPQTATTDSAEPSASVASQSASTAASNDQPFAHITTDDWQLLNARVEEQTQDKVESGSKYRVKLWGLGLFNAFGVFGQVDNIDVPTLAFPRAPGSSSGSVGASLRQSTIGLTGTGPEIFGARTSADLQLDFFGGLPSGYSSGSSGLVRLRLSRIRFDWERTSVIAGLDTPFFSPNLPTSYMSLAVPAFASSGNLWTWSPTVRIERRFDTSFSQLKIEAGFVDPSDYSTSDSPVRTPTATESSRQPVYAVRFSANGHRGDRPVSVGVSGLYLPQHFTYATVSGWGGILDWRFPVIPHLELSGEFFAGKGLEAFGGVPVPVVLPQNSTEYAQIGGPALARMPTVGGWSQLKYIVNSRNEFNVAVGAGDRNSGQLVQAVTLAPSLASLSPRNEMIFANYIFRPRSNLLFSAEYRRLRTYSLVGSPATADQVGLAAGFLF